MAWVLLVCLCDVTLFALAEKSRHRNERDTWMIEKRELTSRMEEMSKVVRAYYNDTISVELEAE